jgi:outer membrane receptor for ferrienterochelin and colicins
MYFATRPIFLLLAAFFAAGFVAAQPSDSLATRQLDELVVTATRNERTMGALPMPVLLVGKPQIQSMGSVRLNDVLTEQPGLVVVPQVNGLGNGIQLQGLNPDYTLILMDGEPIIGRFTGSLELSRIAVGNIRQIEIVKGPSSSLYGSDALAGVINIITDRPEGTKGSVSARYASFQTMDFNADFGFKKDRLGIYTFFNRYRTDGYDLSPQSFGKTVAPFSNYTFSTKITYQFTPAADLSVSVRRFDERQTFGFEVDNAGARIRTFGEGTSRDWNVNTVFTQRFSQRFKTIGRLYATRYQTSTWLNRESDGVPYYTDYFEQTFLRPEANAEWFLNDRNILTLGAGAIRESVQTSRYGDDAQRFQFTYYGFFQHEWMPSDKLSVISGGRLDYNSIYGSQFSPKLSARYELTPLIALKVSSGVGFKAPDFRQVYFNFLNAAGGYSVLGTEVAAGRLNELNAAGQIQAYFFDLATLGKLQAERSWSVNAGATVQVNPRLQGEVNLFHNSIDNLIETQAVALTTNNQTIYSYRNIARAFTQGLELNANYTLFKNWGLAGGYQLLFAKDKDILADVRKGNVFYRDPNTLVTQRLQQNEYVGLYNRSRHMGNIKLFYQDSKTGWEASVRFIYRGRYGVGALQGNIQGENIPPSDINSNGLLDRFDSFVNGYGLLNVAMGKTIQEKLRLQIGVDNMLNHTDPVFIPNIPGRIVYLSARFSFEKKPQTINK